MARPLGWGSSRPGGRSGKSPNSTEHVPAPTRVSPVGASRVAEVGVMATPRYCHCEVYDVRCEVQRRLQLPGPKGPDDPPAKEFWERAERQGRLAEALALFDRIAAGWAAYARTPRETKARFLARVEREGRRAEAEGALAELLA